MRLWLWGVHILRNFKFILDDIFDEHMVFQTKVQNKYCHCPALFGSFQNYNSECHTNRTFSLHNSMSLSGNWFMKVTGMPGVAIIALVHQWVYTQFGGPHFLLIYLIRQKKRISFQSSSFLLTNCIINSKFSKEYTKVTVVDTCTKIQAIFLHGLDTHSYWYSKMCEIKLPLFDYGCIVWWD